MGKKLKETNYMSSELKTRIDALTKRLTDLRGHL